MRNKHEAESKRTPAMTPWPSLAPYAGFLELPKGKGRLFLYDSAHARAGQAAAAGKFPDEDVVQGGAVPLILIHGLGDEADTWRGVFPALAKSRRVLAPDLPGFGRSSWKGRIGFSSHVEAVRALLAESGRAVLVGSSMGAAVAEAAAFAAPESVAALVLLDGGLPSGAGLPPPMIRMLTPLVGERGYRAFRKDREAAYRSLEPYYADLEAFPAEEKSFLRSRVMDRVESDTQMRAYFASLRSFVLKAALGAASFAGKLAAYPGPVLIGWGERDLIMPASTAAPLKAARSDAKTAMFPGAGHLPHQELPGAVVEAIETFIASSL